MESFLEVHHPCLPLWLPVKYVLPNSPTHSCISVMFMVFSTGYLMLKEPYSLFWLATVDNPTTDPAINSFFIYIKQLYCSRLFNLIAYSAKHHFVSKNYVEDDDSGFNNSNFDIEQKVTTACKLWLYSIYLMLA
ncbi:hypothetical protein O9929_24045 [Vibrio lentus]|nr:hypothetical protein [Vibrio lentus]